jgi:hypothetical protein
MLRAMKKSALFLLVVVAIALAALTERSILAGGTDKAARPKRTKMSCGAFRDGMERMAKSAGIPMKVTPGSWSTIPKALQALPPGADLCGAVEGQGAAIVAIVSPLFGKDFETHYAPLFAKIGCQPFTCEVTGSQTTCTCKGSSGRGRIETDRDVEEFSLLFMAK